MVEADPHGQILNPTPLAGGNPFTIVQHAIDNTNANLCNAFKNCNLESHDYLWPLTTQDHSGGLPPLQKNQQTGFGFPLRPVYWQPLGHGEDPVEPTRC